MAGQCERGTCRTGPKGASMACFGRWPKIARAGQAYTSPLNLVSSETTNEIEVKASEQHERALDEQHFARVAYCCARGEFRMDPI